MFESGVSIQRSPVLNFAAMQAQSVLQTAAVVLSKNISEEKRLCQSQSNKGPNMRGKKGPLRLVFCGALAGVLVI